VAIARAFAIGRFEITIDQFSVFSAETGAAWGHHCKIIEGEDGSMAKWAVRQASSREPGFVATGSHPVVCTSWHDAQAYAAWLQRRTGRSYRLPTEAEWEYAARAGTTTRYSFGTDEGRLCEYARFADIGSPFSWRGACRSATTAYGPFPVGRLKPNAWGIFDMHGNVWEWVKDCWTSNVREIPVDGSALERTGSCEIGVMRGGSWAAGYGKLRSAHRVPALTAARHNHLGFRVALSLGPP
jgi:formylglycine-generating enzyme required for sulfatase activity